MPVEEAGVDTWSPSWYLPTDGSARAWVEEFCTARGERGSKLYPDKVLGRYRVGWYPSGLLYAEGHAAPDAALCSAADLPARGLEVLDALRELGAPVLDRVRWRDMTADGSPGWAGLRRVDATVTLRARRRSEGLALLAGVAACMRDAPGYGVPWFGPDRAVESVSLFGYSGGRLLGRWYDKGLESGRAGRGLLIRGEDQRRWGKLHRRDVDDLEPGVLRDSFRRRFYPLWKASRGVTVAGPVVLAEKLIELVAEGRVGANEATALAGHMLMVCAGGRRGAGVAKRTMYRRESRARELGLSVADGVLEEVEVDVSSVLEAALETEAWGTQG